MTSREEIGPVREAHRLNVEALAEYLKKELKGFSGELTVHQFGYGQSNPTFLLSAGGRSTCFARSRRGNCCPRPTRWIGNIGSSRP